MARNYLRVSEFSEQADYHDFEVILQQEFATSKWHDVRVILAVSGGADSVALLRGLYALRAKQSHGELHVVHVNHRWRGEQSDADEQFVADLCVHLEVKCHRLRIQAENKTEEEARNQRYQIFLEKARELGARYVLTAHTQDDQIETLIDRIFRGTGLTGLQGIPRTRILDHGITLLRPMLTHTRTQVLNYLHKLDQDYREDSSNQSLDYTRNRIRNELLPLLKSQYHSDADQAVLRLRETALELSDYLAAEAGQVAEKVLQVCSHEQVVLECTAFQGVASVIVREVLVQLWQQADWPRQAMTRGHWLQLETMVLGASDPLMFPGSIRAEKNGELLSLTRR
ncbi:MAG: tRNA lysidine(34) synthetase TilS [Planctomycetaceae bacterium]|nr:tRNA lysidine(34) synthetase TilS [Planctomycetaceae bacterium]